MSGDHFPDMTLDPAEAVVAAPPPPVAAPVRVQEPMSVVWQGVEHPAAAWDVHGFTLEAPIPRVLAPGRGRVFDVTLLIGRGGTRIEMRVQARAAVAEETAPTRFQFVDLDRPQAEVLHRIVDHVVAHQAMSLTQLLNETEETRTARRETGERVRHLRTGFQLLLAGAVLATAGGLAWANYATVKPRYAAVTAQATSLSVPVAGTLQGLGVQRGQRVSQGEVLGHVRPADHDERLRALAERRRALEADQAWLRARRTEMQRFADVAVQGTGNERAILAEQLQLAERRLQVERQQLTQMRAISLPTAERQRARALQEAVVIEAETRALDLRRQIEGLAQIELLAPMGVVQADLRDNVTTLETLDLRLAAVGEEIAQVYALEESSAPGQPVVSPCDCVVHEIDIRPGEWAAPTDRMLVLLGADTPRVHALIHAERARHIANGDRARIQLADGSRVAGRVSRVNYEAHWPGYSGLQDNVFAADRYARVEIVPEAPITAPVGMVAEVSIQTSRLVLALRDLVGW